jgi:hypothetical protein
VYDADGFSTVAMGGALSPGRARLKPEATCGSAFTDLDLIVSFFFFLIVIGAPIFNSGSYSLFVSDMNNSVFVVIEQAEIEILDM